MYRYSEERFIQSLVTMGCIRVGTLHDFRRTELATGITDPMEGKKIITHRIENFRNGEICKTDLKALRDFRVMEDIPENVNLTMENCVLDYSINHRDLFVLCFSSNKSRNVMAQFEGADTCIAITNQNLFIRILGETLNAHRPVKYRGLHVVNYQDREEVWNGKNWGRHPALIKELRYKEQYEIRAIWEPIRPDPIEPVILCNQRLGNFSKIVDV